MLTFWLSLVEQVALLEVVVLVVAAELVVTEHPLEHLAAAQVLSLHYFLQPELITHLQ
jgi:selenocysteine-specific translation elongation factor